MSPVTAARVVGAHYTAAASVAATDVLAAAMLCERRFSDALAAGAQASPALALLRREADVRRRIRAVLFAARLAGCRSVVLGAWGCGVFANPPAVVARLFADVLGSAEWRGQFEAVVFAFLGRPGSATAAAFRAALSGLAR